MKNRYREEEGTTIRIKKSFRVPGTNVLVEAGDILEVKDSKRKPSRRAKSSTEFQTDGPVKMVQFSKKN